MPGLRCRPHHRVGHKPGIAQSVQNLFEWMVLSRAGQAPLLFCQLIGFHGRVEHGRVERYLRRRPSTLKKKLAKMVCTPSVSNNAAGITMRMVRE